MSKLVINNLHVSVEGKEILKGVDLEVNDHEIHALMGPNGNGKSTLLSAIMGHPKYTVTEGSIFLDDKNVLEMTVDERSRAGLFLGMQYPAEVPGVNNSDFLRAAINTRRDTPQPLFQFIREMEKTIEKLEMKSDLAHRYLNEGFSGGEKKRNEIVQMLMLKPSIALLDEIDSGLDVDALQIVANALLEYYNSSNLSLLVISHYSRFYDLLKPTRTHVLIDGRIVIDGDETLVEKIDKDGYDWIEEEYGVEIRKPETRLVYRLGTCAAGERAKINNVK